MGEHLLSYLSTISGPLALLVSIIVAIRKGQRFDEQDVLTDSKEKAELEMKIKTLEGKIDAQYRELSTQITAVKAAVSEGKTSSLTFETRMLSSVDKLDSKIDRIQDLVIKALITKPE